MSNSDNDFFGFADFNDMLEEYIKTAENVLEELKKTADEFVEDLLKLPKPRSSISKSGYTHLIDTFSSRNTGKDIEVGWGKYYGPMLENGAKQMKKAHPHLNPLWNKNQEKYIKNFKKRNHLI
ncbi:MAG: hypothetical protein ACLSVX_12540 [Massilimicrobiota timonensis]